MNPFDHNELTQNLQVDEKLLVAAIEDSNSSSSSKSIKENGTRSNIFKEQRRTFNIRMAMRGNTRKDEVQYEHLMISGVLKLAAKSNYWSNPSGNKSCLNL